jgi:nicotinate phosphoribosyltransferase
MPRHIDRLAPQRRLQPGALDCDGKAREQHLADRHLVNDRVEPIGKQELNIWRLAAHLYFNQRLNPRMGHHWQPPASCWSISGCAVHMAPKQDFFLAARASYIAGFAGTATMLADKLYGIPTFGTMAHSFIQAYDNESQAFEDFARSRPQDLTILIDTYDTEAAAKKVVALAPRLKLDGIIVRGVRLDSGDLTALSKSVRRILDDGGLKDVSILASGGLDENNIGEMLHAGAPIDTFGVGTSLTTSSDVPALDCAYKLQEYAGLPRRKHSSGKATWPGRKQVWRQYGPDGRMAGDIISVETDKQSGEPLIETVMQGGRRIRASPALSDIRARVARNLALLPEPLRRLEADVSYPVKVADALIELTKEVDRRLVGQKLVYA